MKEILGTVIVYLVWGLTIIIGVIMLMGIPSIYVMMATHKLFIDYVDWNDIFIIMFLSLGIGGLLFFIKKIDALDTSYYIYVFRALWVIIAVLVLLIIITIVMFLLVILWHLDTLLSITLISNLVVICIFYSIVGVGLSRMIELFSPQENKPTQEEIERARNRFRQISNEELNRQAEIYHGQINKSISNLYQNSVAQNKDKIIDLANGIVEDLFSNVSSEDKTTIIQKVEERINIVIADYCEELIIDYFNHDKNREKISQIIEAMIESKLEESIAKKSKIKNSIKKGI